MPVHDLAVCSSACRLLGPHMQLPLLPCRGLRARCRAGFHCRWCCTSWPARQLRGGILDQRAPLFATKSGELGVQLYTRRCYRSLFHLVPDTIRQFGLDADPGAVIAARRR